MIHYSRESSTGTQIVKSLFKCFITPTSNSVVGVKEFNKYSKEAYKTINEQLQKVNKARTSSIL